MSDIKHSPLPFRSDAYYQGEHFLKDAENKLLATGFDSALTKEDAYFIVRACNSHYELIKALSDCRDHLQDIALDSHSGAFEHELVDTANLILTKAKGESND